MPLQSWELQTSKLKFQELCELILCRLISVHVILKSEQSIAYSCVYVQFDLLCAARVHVHERENNFKGADQEADQSLQEERPEQGRPGGDAGERRLLG